MSFWRCPLALRLLSTWRFLFCLQYVLRVNRRRVQLHGVNGRKTMSVGRSLSEGRHFFFFNIFARSASL